jgi:membrane-associated phospholipid phosphatase
MMGLLAVVASQRLGLPIRDPDGFLGPAWIRLPLLVLGAFLADVVPRSAWRSRGNLSRFREEARTIVREHWTHERIVLVVIGLVSFYVTYVSYRNLKNFLPFIREGTQDPLLKAIDEAIFFGGDPAIFLPFVPLSVTAWLVWSRNISFGYWYVTAQCLAWSLGTASYYAIPSLGPAFYYVWLYSGLENTGVTQLQDALFYGRSEVLFNPFNTDGVQSVAGFASLHMAITLLAALVAHYTVRHAWIRWGLWVYVVITAVSTIYFGWHYIADDVAGAFIAVVSVYLGGLATGQKFDRHGIASHPTTSTAEVPVEETVSS